MEAWEKIEQEASRTLKLHQAARQDFSIGYLSHSSSVVELYLQETFTFRQLTTEAVVALVTPKNDCVDEDVDAWIKLLKLPCLML